MPHWNLVYLKLQTILVMKQLNRIKLVLVEKNKTAKWLSKHVAGMRHLFPVDVLMPRNQIWKHCFLL